MDKSWITCNRLSVEYFVGVNMFMEFAIDNSDNGDSLRCPCIMCGNLAFHSYQKVREHLFTKGFDKSYIIWTWHGEMDPELPTYNIKEQVEPEYICPDQIKAVDMIQDAYKHCDDDPNAFKALLEDAEKPLYPGSHKYTKLGALVKLYNLKGKYGWSDTSFSDLLSLLVDMLPDDNTLPKCTYEAKKTMSALGLEYEKIHACPNDCILYRKEYENLNECPTCGVSRWKKKDSSNRQEYRKGIPAKVLWYFPIIPRFKRMFQSPQTAKDLTWHEKERVVDGKLRHPADSPAWKLVDDKWPSFASESRNLRLALSSDGINPHSSLSSTYSCWPVLLVTYNLPPWLCMKRKFMMLSLLISGPQQPGNDIDVYLAPLIEDLQLLWDVGVEAYDGYKKEFFNLRAVLLWTINDFPAYGNLSGCTVKGYYACPYCGEHTTSCRLTHSKKNAYIGHRRFLPPDHPFRDQKKAFYNEVDKRAPPEMLTGHDVWEKVKGIENNWGKGKNNKKRKKIDKNNHECWKKKSIFFDLEYWKHLLVRHQLDVMHIEKNVCESLYGTLLNIPGKTKDGLKSRMDLDSLKIRKELAPNYSSNNRIKLPPASYTLTREEKKRFCEALHNIKVPDSYSSNLKNLVSLKDYKLQGLKSHDCHVLMQQLLAVALRTVLPDHVRYAIIRLCFFFNSLCTTVIDVEKLDQMEKDIVVTLCLLEKCFPPSFFDIMIHLNVHLVHELRLCGPVYLRWMYPFERNMKTLKGYVRNRYRPEGCIAECYIANEALEFCAEYISNMKIIGNPPGHKENLSIQKPIGVGKKMLVEEKLLAEAHLYVLENTEEVQPFISEHMEILKSQFPRESKSQKWLKLKHNKTFSNWLLEKVSKMMDDNEQVSNTLRWVARGPFPEVEKFNGYDVNDFHFLSRNRDKNRVTQNSGVSIVASTMQVASSKDKKPIICDLAFYGEIDEIWQLDYHMFKIPLFKCNWVQNKGGVKFDNLGFTLVDLNRLGHKSDPFILASQAKQVFYTTDPHDKRWSVVCFMPYRGIPYNGNDEELDHTREHVPFTKELPRINTFDAANDDNHVDYARDGGEDIEIEQ